MHVTISYETKVRHTVNMSPKVHSKQYRRGDSTGKMFNKWAVFGISRSPQNTVQER